MTRLIWKAVLACALGSFTAGLSLAQQTKLAPGPAASAPSTTAMRQELQGIVDGSDIFHVVGLGSSTRNAIDSFPLPTVVLQLRDPAQYTLRVRFPGLGLLGLSEDTVVTPSVVNDSLDAYQAMTPLYRLEFPETRYLFYLDVFVRSTGALVRSYPVRYNMNVSRYATRSVRYLHPPTAGLRSSTLRRRFIPKLFPFTLEANPGWQATESYDSSMIYVLAFRNPADSTQLEMSITMRPALVGQLDSSEWTIFKGKARIAFGQKGIAVGSDEEFQVADSASRTVIERCYEFVAMNPDSTYEYVATFLTPRAVLLLFTPLPKVNERLHYEYAKAIARSLIYHPIQGIANTTK